MFRLFVAVEPPAHVRDQLVDLMEGVPGARWQHDEQLHLTVRFIGPVDRHQAADIDLVLGAIDHPAFAVTLGGAGVFERRGRPEALWIGAEPRAALAALHDKVDRALVRAGVPADTRAYVPHVTIARLSRGTAPLGVALDRAGCLRATFIADALTLFQSRLGREGAHHEELGRYPLS